jgi:biotin carboxyl carrier protein
MARAAKPSRLLAFALPLLLVAACSSGSDRASVDAGSSSPTTTTTAPTTAPTTTTTEPPTTVPPPPPGRHVVETGYSPFATTGGITLHHPSTRVEHVGFHQSNHEGAQQLDPLPTAVDPRTLEVRDRLTDDRTAADVVSDPELEIRSPVTGTVKYAGSYVLYCKYSDHYLVIEPDEHPGWEVKLLHIGGLDVGVGDRVTAGDTVVAPHPTLLPFESQVDELRTADPAWPHVHIEVIDPSIPNVPNPGSGGC